MPRKKRSREQWTGGRPIKNPPEKFAYIDGDLRMFGDGLDTTPDVSIKYAHSAETWDKVRDWMKECNLQRIRYYSIHRDGTRTEIPARKVSSYDDLLAIAQQGKDIEKVESVSRVSTYEKLVSRLEGLFELDPARRKELYQKWREGQIAKLDAAIPAFEKAIAAVWNDDVRLKEAAEFLAGMLQRYKAALERLKKERTGKHKLMYELIRPLVEELKTEGLSKYRMIEVLDRLFIEFNYDVDAESVLNEIDSKPDFPPSLH